MRRACASLDLAEMTGSPFAMSQALAEVARCHRELHDDRVAEAHFELAVRWARVVGSADHLADLLCEQADAAVRVALAQDLRSMIAADAAPRGEPVRAPGGHAARERARDCVFEVSQLVGHLSDAACEARMLLRVSEVLERCGDHADALQMQRRAFDLMGGIAPREAGQVSGLGRLADL
jgi:hypothetical protein